MLGRYRSDYIYIMANLARTPYVGMTSGRERRVPRLCWVTPPGFTTKYRPHTLVYSEEFPYVYDALAREKQLQGWLREKKVALIETPNPTWVDLGAEW